MDCVFCDIVAGRTDTVFSRDTERDLVAFEPLNPYVPGHMLFVPETHLEDATSDPSAAATVFEAAAEWLGDREGNILTSVGPSATQTVWHLHIHVLPRGPFDGIPRDWPWQRDQASPPPCQGHRETQHRDGKPPWCDKCGWTRGRHSQPARKIGAPRG